MRLIIPRDCVGCLVAILGQKLPTLAEAPPVLDAEQLRKLMPPPRTEQLEPPLAIPPWPKKYVPPYKQKPFNGFRGKPVDI